MHIKVNSKTKDLILDLESSWNNVLTALFNNNINFSEAMKESLYLNNYDISVTSKDTFNIDDFYRWFNSMSDFNTSMKTHKLSEVNIKLLLEDTREKSYILIRNIL